MKTFYPLFLSFFIVANLFSQDFSGIKICINPGHGGHDGDDRYIEETGFWESEGNLTKGLYLRDILESCGATIVMTRVTNNTSDDLPLSQISQIANDNNVDFFQSIHSNAYDGMRNYPLVLFRGYDNDPLFPEAKAMGHIMWQLLWKYGNGWTNTGERNRGDLSFYPQWGTQGLGVLRHLEMPGVLSEGSFHDYPPESWRLMNLDYRKHESWVFAKSYFKYFQTDTSGFGNVAGIIRDSLATPDYYFDSHTLDKNAPIEKAIVTMNPGNYIYQTDTLHNGYFFFDSIAPGNYTLTIAATNYYADTMEISVVPNQTSFFNEYLQTDTTVVPKILYHTPVSTIEDSVALNQEFKIYFSYPMNTGSVENAISISPEANLKFKWNKDLKVLSIKPQTIFNPDSHYTITISTDAKQKWNVPISESYSFDFYTKNRTKLVLEKTYPVEGLTEVSPVLQFRLYFDAPLDRSSIDNNIILYDSEGNELSFIREEISEDAGKGYYFFEPENALKINSEYKLFISGNLSDEYGIALNQDYEINFKTISKEYKTGTVFLDFENISSWWDPDGSGSTTGTIDELTTFTLASDHFVNGEHSGRLDYAFLNESGGVVREHNTDKPSVGSDQNSEIGFWVFGDLSHNILEYWFYPPSGYSPVFVDTIDWAGWAFKSIPFSAINSSGHTRFTSVVVVQTENGNKKGTLYFDDGQIITTTGTNDISFDQPIIEQNYPNPFDKYTTFSFNIPDESYVRLAVYDLMGKRVATLINEKRNRGIYNYRWNATSDNGSILNKGIYVYRFETISVSDISKIHIQTGKCIFMR